MKASPCSLALEAADPEHEGVREPRGHDATKTFTPSTYAALRCTVNLTVLTEELRI